MTLQIYVAGVDQAYRVRFPPVDALGLTEFADGTVATGSLIIDDPDGTYDKQPLNAAYVVETTAAPTRVWTGYILNQTESRGPYRSGPSRIITCDTMDENRNLYIRPVLSNIGYRPAEWDIDRVAWLLDDPACAGLVYQGAFTNLTDNPIHLDATDYRDRRPGEILADFTPVAGKRFFARYNPSTDKVELFYDLTAAAINDASGSITNRRNLLTTGIYPPDDAAEWNRSGESLFSDSEVVYKGTGRVVAHNATTKSTYGEMWDVYTTDRIGELATAQAAADLDVSIHSAPEETLTCTLQLHRASMNDFRAGERMQVQIEHFSGMQSAWVYLRITKREIHLHETGDALVSLEATNKVLRSPGGSGRGGGNFPPPPVSPSGVVQQVAGHVDSGGHLVLPSAPTPGNSIVTFITARGAPSFSSGWTEHPDGLVGITGTFNCGARMGWRAVTGGDTATIQVSSPATGADWATLWEVDGSITTYLADSANHSTTTAPATITSGSITTVTDSALLLSGALVNAGGWPGNDNETVADDAAWTHTGKHEVFRPHYISGNDDGDDSEPLCISAYKQVSATGTYSPAYAIANPGNGFLNFGGWGGLMIAIESSSIDNQPAPGTPMPWAVVTVTPGSTTSTGTTAWPYAATTLEVMVDGVIINHASYTETDPTTGDFTLSWVIDADNVVQVRYISA